MIQFGLRLHDAEKLPIEQVLPLVHQKGFSCVHLALSKSLKEVPSTLSASQPTESRVFSHFNKYNYE